MYTSLYNAPINTPLVLLQVENLFLSKSLQRLGLFEGSRLMRRDEEITFHPLRIRGPKGDVVVPAGMAGKVVVHLDSGERFPMVEMEPDTHGHIEAMTCGMGAVKGLAKLGLKEGSEVTCIRKLPHMDYLTVIDRKERTRLSEGEAAKIWGRSNGDKMQFFFSRQGRPFVVEEILGGPKSTEYIHTHGVAPGKTLILESIEHARELHWPKSGAAEIIISTSAGLRLYLKKSEAKQIVVRAAGPRSA